IALLVRRLADAVDELPVDSQFDDAVDRHDVVCIPLAASLRAVLQRTAANAAWIVGYDLNASSTKQVAMHIRGRERLAISPFTAGYGIKLQHLHFDSSRQTILLAGLRVTPDENPGIP